MADTAPPATAPGSAPADPGLKGGPASKPSLLDSALSLARELPGLLSDRAELLSLELKRAGLALVQIVVLVVAAAVLAVTAWLALWACAVGGLMALGLHWAAALLIVLALNVVAVVLALVRVRRLLPLLRLPASRRHLLLNPATKPPETPSAPPVTAKHEHTAAATS